MLRQAYCEKPSAGQAYSKGLGASPAYVLQHKPGKFTVLNRSFRVSNLNLNSGAGAPRRFFPTNTNNLHKRRRLFSRDIARGGENLNFACEIYIAQALV